MEDLCTTELYTASKKKGQIPVNKVTDKFLARHQRTFQSNKEINKQLIVILPVRDIKHTIIQQATAQRLLRGFYVYSQGDNSYEFVFQWPCFEAAFFTINEVIWHVCSQ